jgi:diguanylate cyclase (GGDEF)-like protein/PAS domain S-box-containing protein
LPLIGARDMHFASPGSGVLGMIEVDSAEKRVNVPSATSAAPFAAVRRLFESARPAEIVPSVLVELAEHVGSSIVMIYDLTPATGHIRFNAKLSPPLPFDPETGPLSGEALEPWLDQLAAGCSVTIALEDLPPDDRPRLAVYGTRSIVLTPLKPQRSLTSLLAVASPLAPANLPSSACALIDLTAQTLSAALARRTAPSTAELHADQRLTTILAYAVDSIVVLDADGTILFHSPSFVLGSSAPFEGALGESAFSFVHPDDQPRIQRTMGELLSEPGCIRSVELRLKQDDGSWRYYDTIGTNQLDNPAVNGIVITAHDVTERKELEQRLNWQALHDPLTKLPNRSLLLNDLEHALARIERTDETIALLYLDLDGFKAINDSLGHPAGDQFLILIGERLRSTVRVGETVARFGGDEFTVLLEGLSDPVDAERAADRILAALSSTVYLGNQPLAITTSIGISVATNHATTAEDMLSEADTALYAAKRAGKARYVRFAAALRATDDDLNPC